MFETWLYSLIEGYYFKAFFLGFFIIFALSAALHAVVYKRKSRAALGWFAFIFSSPVIGPLLYYFFGINRIERKANRLQVGLRKTHDADSNWEDLPPKLQGIRVTGESLSYSPICENTEILTLNTGDEAYPKMLEAIDEATSSIHLFSYIFELDKTGEMFVEKLIAAKKRGVEVRILVDGVGSKKTLKELRKSFVDSGVKFEVFLPVVWRPNLANLRNHRKLLITDGKVAFTGGLNIAEIYWPSISRFEKVLDFHFRLRGEIVRYLQAVFVDDWFFVTEEALEGEPYFHDRYEKFPENNHARVVIDGPGDTEEKMRWHFISAINGAEKKIQIASPYFLPDSGVATALISAALRGVQVDILIPSELDHKIVQWAMFGSFWEILSHNCRVWLSPPPFDHSKLFIVDEKYTSIGSSNWDPRSLRLNFEMNVEVYCPKLSKELSQVFNKKKEQAKAYSLADHENRPYPSKVRDGFSRMFSPYL